MTAQQFIAQQTSLTAACHGALERFDQAYDGGQFTLAQDRARDTRGPCRDLLRVVETIQAPASDPGAVAFRDRCSASYRLLVDWLGEVSRYHEPRRPTRAEERRGSLRIQNGDGRDRLRRRQDEVNTSFEACQAAADAIRGPAPANAAG